MPFCDTMFVEGHNLLKLGKLSKNKDESFTVKTYTNRVCIGCLICERHGTWNEYFCYIGEGKNFKNSQRSLPLHKENI